MFTSPKVGSDDEEEEEITSSNRPRAGRKGKGQQHRKRESIAQRQARLGMKASMLDLGQDVEVGNGRGMESSDEDEDDYNKEGKKHGEVAAMGASAFNMAHPYVDKKKKEEQKKAGRKSSQFDITNPYNGQLDKRGPPNRAGVGPGRLGTTGSVFDFSGIFGLGNRKQSTTQIVANPHVERLEKEKQKQKKKAQADAETSPPLISKQGSVFGFGNIFGIMSGRQTAKAEVVNPMAPQTSPFRFGLTHQNSLSGLSVHNVDDHDDDDLDGEEVEVEEHPSNRSHGIEVNNNSNDSQLRSKVPSERVSNPLHGGGINAKDNYSKSNKSVVSDYNSNRKVIDKSEKSPPGVIGGIGEGNDEEEDTVSPPPPPPEDPTDLYSNKIVDRQFGLSNPTSAAAKGARQSKPPTEEELDRMNARLSMYKMYSPLHNEEKKEGGGVESGGVEEGKKKKRGDITELVKSADKEKMKELK